MKRSIKQQLRAFEVACRQSGLRLTPQRLGIFQALVEVSNHPTADQLHQILVRKMPTLSLDTVYRTLATLAQNGLVNKVDTVESQARYEVQKGPHHHAICHKCREIIDFECPLIDDFELPEKVKSWGEISRKSFTIYGICQKCL